MDFITAHGLLATIIPLLISAGHSDTAFAWRTGHRYRNSLRTYHNLRGIDGEAQLGTVFRGFGAVQGKILDQAQFQAN